MPNPAHVRLSLAAALAASLLLSLAACGGGTPTPECGSGSPPIYNPRTFVVKVDGAAFNGRTILDIPVSRPAGASRTLLIEYAVDRPPGFCGGSYLGAWSFHYDALPTGVTATYDPASLPPIQSTLEVQTLRTTLTIAPSVADGRVPLKLLSTDIGPSYGAPFYTLVLTTAP